jgi:DNA-directed RNA polymerase subunit E'/Rpb7
MLRCGLIRFVICAAWKFIAMVDIVGRNSDYDMMINVGGLENDEFLVWSRQELRIGDEIRIRIVETKSIDAPVERKPNVST